MLADRCGEREQVTHGLRGASPVGRDNGGSLYVARTISEEESGSASKKRAFGGAVVDPSRFHHEDATGILQRRPIATEGGGGVASAETRVRTATRDLHFLFRVWMQGKRASYAGREAQGWRDSVGKKTSQQLPARGDTGCTRR